MSALPFSLDPLIAEAKRRMRRRRLATVAVVLLLAGGIAGAVAALGNQSPPRGSALTPASSNLPPLSNLAARAFWCGDAYDASGRGGCHSPDGRWAIVVDNTDPGCTLTVTRVNTRRHERILQGGTCVPDLWIGNRFVVQEDIYGSKGRVVSFSPPSRRPRVLAHFGTFVVSPDRHWIAGEVPSQSPFGSHLVAVVSLTSQTCRVVAQAKGVNHYVSVDKSPWSIHTRTPPTHPYRNPVYWRTVIRNGKKIRVVTGPGTGFTRNSRSVIVAKWERSGGANTPLKAVHKHLVKLDISSLHTPCPAGLVPRG